MLCHVRLFLFYEPFLLFGHRMRRIPGGKSLQRKELSRGIYEKALLGLLLGL